MPLTTHDLILLGAVALAAFIGARLGSGGKSDAAGIARLERKMDSVLSHLGLASYNPSAASTPTASAPTVSVTIAGTRNAFSSPVSDEIVSELRRGRKIEAINLYRDQHQVGLKEAKDAIDRLEQTLR